jgi:hypothetical protein
LSSRVIRYTTRLIALGVAAGTLAGYSAYAKRWTRPELALNAAGEFGEPQMSNAAAKADRLALAVATALPEATKAGARFQLASASQGDDFSRFNDVITGAMPTAPVAVEPKAVETKPAEAKAPEIKAPESKSAETKHASLAPVAPEKPKHVAPPPQASNLLDDGQIAGLRSRLRLTSDQAEYWPAVEEALREVARGQIRSAARHARGGKINIDVNSAEVQKLIWAAMPLLMRMREDQKNEVRKLARVLGLEQVASQI